MSTTDPHEDLEVVDLEAAVEDHGARTRLVPPSETPGDRAREALRNPWTWVAVVVLLLAWAGASALHLLSVRDDVREVRTGVDQARAALAAGDVDGATAIVDEAGDVLRDLPDRVTGPLAFPARMVPTYRRTLEAVEGLGTSGAIAVDAGRDVLDAVADRGLESLTPTDLRVPLDALTDLVPVLEGAAADVDRAVEVARGTAVFGVVPEVAEGRAELLDLLEPAAGGLRTGADLVAALPAMLGADEPRRWLVLSSNPTENRGTGGFFGAATVVTADDGALSFGEVRETLDLPIPPRGEVEWADPSLAERWDRYGGASRLRSINLSPDFPAVATTVERYWAAAFDEQLDGVIAVDPFALEALLAVSGPLDVPGYGTVPAEEVVEFATHAAYSLEERPDVRKDLVGQLTITALQRVLAGGDDIQPAQLLQALGRVAGRDSVLVHSTVPEEQAVLVEADVAGELTAEGGDLLAVVLNSGSGSKIDYFLDRTVTYDVTLRADGSAAATTTVGLVNTAPTEGELTYMIGPPEPGVPFGAGDNVSHVSVYCAPGCGFVEVPDIGWQDLPTERSVELGFPVASTWTLIPSGRAQSLAFATTVPGVWSQVEDQRTYRLHYRHQPAIRPTDLRVRVAAPEGWVVADAPEGASVIGSIVELDEDVTTDRDLEITFRRP